MRIITNEKVTNKIEIVNDEYIKLTSDFTVCMCPYLIGLIIGYFDKGKSDLTKTEVLYLARYIEKNDIRDRKGNEIELSYDNFVVVNYNSYCILIYDTVKPVSWNGNTYKIGLLKALKEYSKVIKHNLENYLCKSADILIPAVCYYSENYDYEDTIIKYLSINLRVFGKYMFDTESDLYDNLYTGIMYRAYRNASMRCNKGFKDDNAELIVPTNKEVNNEKIKLIKRISRYRVHNAITI